MFLQKFMNILINRQSQTSIEKAVSSQGLEKSPSLKNQTSTTNICKSNNKTSALKNTVSSSSKTVSNMFDLQKLKSFKNSCANGARRSSKKLINIKSGSKNKDQSAKKLNKVKLDSNGRPVAGSDVNASNASSSVLINRLTDSLKNMKLKRSSKNRSDKKQSTKVDKNGVPLNKSASSSSKQSKKHNMRCLDKIEWKKQQGIPLNRNSANMFDNFLTNFHNFAVPKNGSNNGKRYYIENPSQSSYKIDDRVYENVSVRDQKSDRTYDELT